MANKIIHSTIMQKSDSGDKIIIYPKTVTKNVIDGSTTLDKTLETLKASDISNKTTEFTKAVSRENLVSGESLATSHGKIMKLISDLKSLAYTDKVGVSNLDTDLVAAYNNRLTTDKVTTSTTITSAGYVADARAVNNLQKQINTVNKNIDSIFNSKVPVKDTNINVGGNYDVSPDTLNIPYKEYGVLSVRTANGRAWVYQEAIFHGINRKFYRLNINNTGWTDWEMYITNSDLKNLIVRRRLDLQEVILNAGETLIPFDYTSIMEGYDLLAILQPSIAYTGSHVPARITFTEYQSIAGTMRVYSDTDVAIRLFLEVLLIKK